MGIVIFVVIFYVRFRLDRYEYALRSRSASPDGPSTDYENVSG
jgi:hypothetical protein